LRGRQDCDGLPCGYPRVAACTRRYETVNGPGFPEAVTFAYRQAADSVSASLYPILGTVRTISACWPSARRNRKTAMSTPRASTAHGSSNAISISCSRLRT
jgi:hypothetical protein